MIWNQRPQLKGLLSNPIRKIKAGKAPLLHILAQCYVTPTLQPHPSCRASTCEMWLPQLRKGWVGRRVARGGKAIFNTPTRDCLGGTNLPHTSPGHERGLAFAGFRPAGRAATAAEGVGGEAGGPGGQGDDSDALRPAGGDHRGDGFRRRQGGVGCGIRAL